VQVNQPVYSFGRLGLAFHVASTQVRSQSEANRRSRQQIGLQSLDAFYAVLTTQARLEVINASLRRQSRTVGFLTSNFQMGSGTRSAVLLAVSSLKALEPDRIRAERDADAARMGLNRLLGRPVDDSLALDTTAALEAPAPTVNASESGITSILDQRPDLTSMRLQTEALHGYARGYRMQYLPSLGAQGKWGITAFDVDHQLIDFKNNLNWAIGLGLQWTLFDGFVNSSRAHEFDADARSMELSERQARAYARIEIKSALRDAAAADTAYDAALQSRDAAAEADSLITNDFRSGKGQITDLLTAEEGLRNAEFGMLNARYRKVRAKAALRVALGMDLIEGDYK
jgi:HAE1 family hydrophobic/amphiphilic exporter-1